MNEKNNLSVNQRLFQMQSSFGYRTQSLMLANHFNGDLECMISAATFNLNDATEILGSQDQLYAAPNDARQIDCFYGIAGKARSRQLRLQNDY